jgi:hypothetical protein
MILNSLRIKTRLLKRLQHAIVVDCATHSQNDGVEGNGGSLEDGAEAFVLFLRSAQLASSVLTVLDLDEVDVTLENAAIFGSVLSGEGGSADGWQCCRGAPSHLPHLPPATPKYPPPSTTRSLLLFLFRGDGRKQYGIRTAGGKPIFV